VAKFFRRRPRAIPKIRIFKNESIRARTIRLIDENGEQVGVISRDEGLKLAREKSLDLIEISPKAEPPVCKIGDFGSFLFNKQKAEKKQRAASRKAELKEVRLSVRISQNDLKVKAERARSFLLKNSPVKVTLQFRGRENSHAELGFEKVKNFVEILAEVATPEAAPRKIGSRIILTLRPEKVKKEK